MRRNRTGQHYSVDGETLCTPVRCAPVTAIFNCSFREGKLPDLWKTATVVQVPKKHPPGSLERGIRPISLTPILAKVFEVIVLNWVVDVITPQIGERQFGGLSGTCMTDALVEMVHTWYEATCAYCKVVGGVPDRPSTVHQDW